MPLVGLMVFLTCWIVSRFMNEIAYKHIDKLQKGELVESLSGLRKCSPLVLLPFLAILFFGRAFLGSSRRFNEILAWLFLIIALVVLEVLVFQKMKSIQLPAKYIRSYISAHIVFLIGFVALVIMSL